LNKIWIGGKLSKSSATTRAKCADVSAMVEIGLRHRGQHSLELMRNSYEVEKLNFSGASAR